MIIPASLAFVHAPVAACNTEFEAEVLAGDRQVRPAADTGDYADRCRSGEVALKNGALDQAAAQFERAVNAAENDRQRGDALRRRGYIALEMGEILLGQEYFNRSFDVARSADDERAMFQVLGNLAQVRASLSDQAGAAAILQQAIDTGKALLREEADDTVRTEIVKLSYNLVNVLIEIDRPIEARQVLSSAKPYLQENDNAFFRAFYDMLDGELSRLEGDLPRSKRLLESSLARVDQAPNASFRFSMFARLADTYEALGDAPGMARMVERIFADIDAMDPPSPRLLRLAHRLQGRSRMLSGDMEGAAQSFEAAYRAAEEFYAEANAAEMARLEAAYDKEGRENQINSLQADNAAAERTVTAQRVGIMLGIVVAVLAVLIAYLLWQRQRDRQRLDISLARHEAVLDERARIAREVHDTLLQGLMSISLQTQRAIKNFSEAPETALEALRAIRSSAADTSTTGRRAILRYRGEGSGRGIAYELEEIAREAAGQKDILVEQNCSSKVHIAPELVTDLLSIVRQSVINAFLHGSEPVSVSIDCEEGAIVTRIADAGEGFDAGSLPAGRHGVRGMIERARMSGLELVIAEHGRSEIIVKAPAS